MRKRQRVVSTEYKLLTEFRFLILEAHKAYAEVGKEI
jgi:hypothetical protein